MRRAWKLARHVLLWLALLPAAVGSASAYYHGWPSSWRAANWQSSGLLPDAGQVDHAEVIILATRTGGWKSIFAEHMSIVLKRANDKQWTRYEVVGWGSPVRRNAYAPDAFWYGNRPHVVTRIIGDEASVLIPRIEASISQYPYAGKGTYRVWPGPNSNTFVSWIVRHTEGFAVELPPVAVGKDYLGPGFEIADAPSHTGYTISLWGAIGATVALREGLEINLLGTAIGIDPEEAAVKLASFGRIGPFNLMGD